MESPYAQLQRELLVEAREMIEDTPYILIRQEQGPCHVVPLHAKINPDRLWLVMHAMVRAGPPILRATLLHGRFYLHEGTHRAQAARVMRCPIIINPVPWAWTSRAAARARFRSCLCGFCVVGGDA